MFTSIFSKIPVGVNIRRLDETRKIQGGRNRFKFTAWTENEKNRVYGNSIPELLRKLNRDVEVGVQ